MNEIVMNIVIQTVLPTLSLILAGFVTYFLPKLLNMLDKWLTTKFKLQQELLTEAQEAAIAREAVKWLNYAEEYARSEFVNYNKKISSTEKLSVAAGKLAENSDLSLQQAQEKILSELGKTR